MQLVSAVRSDAMVRDADVLQLAVYRHPWVWFLAWAVTFVCVVTLAYNERARRSHPTNWITLCIFTVGPSSYQPCSDMRMHPGAA